MTELHELRSPPGQDEPLAENLAERMEQPGSSGLGVIESVHGAVDT